MRPPDTPLGRWRLVLGEAAGDALDAGALGVEGHDGALAFLYERGEDLEGRGLRRVDREAASRRGGLTVPAWVERIHALFPRETVERLEQDAVERCGIEALVTDPEVMARLEPNPALLRAVLRHKHRMSPRVLAMARRLVARVAARILEELAREVRAASSGALDRRRGSPLPVARNLDLRETLRRNLHRYDPEARRVVIERPRFFARTRRHTERWRLVVLVDQSGSMLGSAVHAALSAACFCGIPGVDCNLVLFDTEVVDLSAHLDDPVELLMRVQLGGGTRIARALRYGARLVERPRRTILVLVTDFHEGGDRRELVRRVGELHRAGVTVLGLATLDEEAEPAFDRELARACAEAGAHVGAMTPGQLVRFVAERVRA